jgi:hypothetical protein
MAQTGFTPIQIYHSTAVGVAPDAANLANGELAINIADGKLYYKDSLGVVQVIADVNESSHLTWDSANNTLIVDTTGSLKIPVGTTAQQPATPSTGMIRFNTTISEFVGYDGTAWAQIGGGATGGGGDKVFVQNQTVVTTNYTLTTGYNAESVGPITINSGITVTVPSGQRWVIL